MTTSALRVLIAVQMVCGTGKTQGEEAPREERYVYVCVVGQSVTQANTLLA